MRNIGLGTTTGALCLALALVACGGGTPAAGATDADKAAQIAKEIKADPSAAEAVLKKHGMTEDEFEALMFKIAEDPKAAEQFANKMGS